MTFALSSLQRPVSGLVRLFFPPRCPLCAGAHGGDELAGGRFCQRCLDDFRSIQSPCCPRCSLPYAVVDGSDHLCEDCQRHEPPYVWAAAAGIFEGSVRQAIHRFKFEGRLDLDLPLAHLLLAHTGERIATFSPDLIVGVPLHRRRLRERTYNQALLLARRLGIMLKKPCPASALRRLRDTASQQQLSRDERRRNLRSAFEAEPRFADRRVLLVDDVMTTGATVSGCAAALRRAGAAQVAVVTLARATRLGIVPPENAASIGD